MENQQPEATQAAIKQLQADFNSHAETAAKELRRLHARNQELEAMLDALGAGGVSAQRVMQGKDHIAQPTQMATTTVVLPEPVGTVGAAPGTSGFTLTVFEAARVPVGTNIYTEQQVRELLATGSQPQADARDAELVAAVVYAGTEAMDSSMESPSFDESIILESHHAASLSLALDELEQHRAAIAASKEKAK